MAYNRPEFSSPMNDPRNTEASGPDDPRADVERDAKIDELLLAGLEHYFANRFQEAINIWGRVLFLDRGHARARAYIERARGALAEQQRRSEELVHEGVAALGRGEDGVARELLASAAERGDPHDVARAYLDRLGRLSTPPAARDRATPASRRPTPPRAIVARSRLRRVPRPIRALPLVALALAGGAIIFFAASRDLLKPLLDLRLTRPASGATVMLPPDPLPVPRAAELALSRARSLHGSGQLKAALAALDGVPDADPLAADAGRARADIQRALLDTLREPGAPSPGAAAARASRPPEARE